MKQQTKKRLMAAMAVIMILGLLTGIVAPLVAGNY